MIHHYFPERSLKYSYSNSLGQSNSLNATKPAMDRILHIMSLAALLNEIPLQAARGINTHRNLSFQVFLPHHLICGTSLHQLHLPQPCAGQEGCALVQCSTSSPLLPLGGSSWPCRQRSIEPWHIAAGWAGFASGLIRSSERGMRCSSPAL